MTRFQLKRRAFVNTAREFQAGGKAEIAARLLACHGRLFYMELILSWRDYIPSSEVSERPGMMIR
jgi:hypothetical protein